MNMSSNKYILTLDQGTTSSRAIIFDKQGSAVNMAQHEFTQYYPHSGWVEHDPQDILDSQFNAVNEVIGQVDISDIEAIAITNQRETTLIWNADTSKPIYNAIVWQCRRTAAICEDIKAQGLAEYIQATTGLVIDAYFSATKIKWILDHVEGARTLADAGKLRFGTVDSWLLWNLTEGRVHATDYSNASRTMLYDIHDLCWDDKLLQIFGIPASMMPVVQDSSGVFGYANLLGRSIPIASMIGDQQAALFGQACFESGEAKNTYGTGCFVLINTGEKCVKSYKGLLSTIAWGIDGKIVYALEGSVFNAGAAIQWLRDGLKIIQHASECDTEASKVADSGGVYFVPAFTGLGAPYWDMYARGTMLGITRGTTNAHIIRAVLESIAYQSADIVNTMINDSNIVLKELKVDGGASASDIILQFQADILGVSVNRPINKESTALGAAYLSGLAVGMWRDTDELKQIRVVDKMYLPSINQDTRNKLYHKWLRAVERSRDWEQS